MAYRIELVDIADHFEAARDLFRRNWSETGFDFTLQPALAMYRTVQASGMWFALGAFLDDELVGYSSAMCAPHPFNPSVVFCNSDALFVAPEHRKSTVSGRLIVATEDEARRRGAKRMLWHTRAGTRLADVLRKRGYEDADVIVMRRLQDGN